MNSNLLRTTLICLTLFTVHFAHADSTGSSLRCGIHSITTGWHLSQILHHCGEPESTETYHYDTPSPDTDIVVVELVYTSSSGKWLLRFLDERLAKIESIANGEQP